MGHKGTARARWWAYKLSFVLPPVGLFQIHICLLHSRNAMLGQFFNQTVLVGTKGPLTTSTRLGRVGCIVFDAKLLASPLHLGEICLVNLAPCHWGGEVVHPRIGVQTVKQAVAGYRLPDSVQARSRSLLLAEEHPRWRHPW